MEGRNLVMKKLKKTCQQQRIRIIERCKGLLISQNVETYIHFGNFRKQEIL